MTREEESGLIKRVKDGDAGAFEPLILEHQKKVYNLAYRMLGNAEDASDVSQETFLRAFTSLRGFRGECKFSVWLYRLTSNISIDLIRKRGEKTISLDAGEDAGTHRVPEIGDLRFSPESELEKKELREAIGRGLERLNPDHRRILLLREIGGLDYEEIGNILKLEPGTVKSRIFRARKQLCGFLTETGNIPEGYPSKKSSGV
ncbi:MAG: sigma-70 family RNA polymerase sigma factor [Oscillospiraceae bacterium]|nr:sigma-70 family RNA polymerase sigma factor [Oscillospiraceae bacterium]